MASKRVEFKLDRNRVSGPAPYNRKADGWAKNPEYFNFPPGFTRTGKDLNEALTEESPMVSLEYLEDMRKERLERSASIKGHPHSPSSGEMDNTASLLSLLDSGEPVPMQPTVHDTTSCASDDYVEFYRVPSNTERIIPCQVGSLKERGFSIHKIYMGTNYSIFACEHNDTGIHMYVVSDIPKISNHISNKNVIVQNITGIQTGYVVNTESLHYLGNILYCTATPYEIDVYTDSGPHSFSSNSIQGTDVKSTTSTMYVPAASMTVIQAMRSPPDTKYLVVSQFIKVANIVKEIASISQRNSEAVERIVKLTGKVKKGEWIDWKEMDTVCNLISWKT